MGVEDFGVNLYLLQVIFGGVDIPAKFITILSMSYLGRHTTEVIALLLAGVSILALIFVPSGEKLAAPWSPWKRLAHQARVSAGTAGCLGLGGRVGAPAVLLLALSHCVALSRSLSLLGLRSRI